MDIKLKRFAEEPSVLKLTENSYEVISGVLLDLKDNIIKVERHHRRAVVKLHIAGQEQIIKLSYVLQMPDNNGD